MRPILCLCRNTSAVGLFSAAGEKRSQAQSAMKRLHEEVSEFYTKLIYFPGRLNFWADYLSRPGVSSATQQQIDEGQQVPRLSHEAAEAERGVESVPDAVSEESFAAAGIVLLE